MSSCIRKCRERLARARDGIAMMETAQTLGTAERGWSEFLLAVASIYSKLEQGAKTDGKSAAWFGRVKKERKDDHLLRYLHHARNSDEHSINDITAVRDWSYRLHPVKSDEEGILAFQVESRPEPSWILLTVRDDRFGDAFDPPGWHMGNALIDESPINVAKVGYSYMESLIDVAEAMGI